MRQVIFKSISITNFLSVGEPEITLQFQKGITLVTGENRDKGGRNGVGKSTISDALFWGLFGSTLREIKQDKIAHNISENPCQVIVSFDIVTNNKTDSYVLIRKLNPNKVFLYCNEVDISKSSMPKTDEFVKELICASEEVFRNAVIMSANNTLPFMAQKKVEKRKFVEGILHLGVFSEMLLSVRNDYNDTRKENEVVCFKFSSSQKTLENYKQQHQSIEAARENRIIVLKTRSEEISQKIKSLRQSDVNLVSVLKKEIETLDGKEIKLKEMVTPLEDTIKTLQKSAHSLEFEMERKEKEKRKLLNETGTCPTCKRDYSGEDHKEHILALVQVLDQAIEDLQKDLQVQEQAIREKKTEQKKINSALETLLTLNKEKHKELSVAESAETEIQLLEVRLREIESEVEEARTLKNDLKDVIDQTQKQVSEIEGKISELQKKMAMLETAKYVVSEEGVKTYIIKKMLTSLNSRLNFYLQALEAPCKCEFNEMFEETIFNDSGKECSYFNFSGGERRRIDLAILFMFQDILRLQTGTSFSLSFYDELLDSAVDKKGIGKIMEILRSRVDSYQENIYIVSHNAATVEAGHDQILLLEKHNGKTIIVS